MSELIPSLARLRVLISQRTPARLLAGRAGTAYRTSTQLNLRADHAAARDAVWAGVEDQLAALNLFSVCSRATSRHEFLLRPDLGRQFRDEAKEVIARNCPVNPDIQLAIGDGLSAAAVIRQVPRLLPALVEGIVAKGWSVGRSFLIQHARVGLLNDIGELLSPRVAILLIGERPGLATAESLSAYMAFRPKAGDTDAKRNLISNIHDRGLPPEDAVPRIIALAEQMMRKQTSGTTIKEELHSSGSLLKPEVQG